MNNAFQETASGLSSLLLPPSKFKLLDGDRSSESDEDNAQYTYSESEDSDSDVIINEQYEAVIAAKVKKVTIISVFVFAFAINFGYKYSWPSQHFTSNGNKGGSVADTHTNYLIHLAIPTQQIHVVELHLLGCIDMPFSCSESCLL